MLLEGLGQLENAVTSSGFEPATLQLLTVPQLTTLPRFPKIELSSVELGGCTQLNNEVYNFFCHS
jgi:hypothetical protein